jgi:hypothetical protein
VPATPFDESLSMAFVRVDEDAFLVTSTSVGKSLPST